MRLWPRTQTLSNSLTAEEKQAGMCFPAVGRVREVTTSITAAVACEAFTSGFAEGLTCLPDVEYVKARMYDPQYQTLVSVKDYF